MYLKRENRNILLNFRISYSEANKIEWSQFSRSIYPLQIRFWLKSKLIHHGHHCFSSAYQISVFGVFIWGRVKPGSPKEVSSKLIWSFFAYLTFWILNFRGDWSNTFFYSPDLSPEMIQKFSTPKLHDRMCQTPLCQTCCCSIKCGRRRYIQSRVKCGL